MPGGLHGNWVTDEQLARRAGQADLDGKDGMTAEDKIAELEHRLGIVEDELAISRLQHAYGYYLDKCYYDEVVDLFDEDGEVIFIGGVYKTRAGIARLYTGRFRSRFADGVNGPAHGRLLDHPMLQDIVHVEPDRRTAYARYRTLMQAGTHESVATEQAPVRQWMEGGLYENVYVSATGCGRSRSCSTGRSGTAPSTTAGRTRRRTTCRTRRSPTPRIPMAPTSCLRTRRGCGRTPRRCRSTTATR